MWRSFPDDWVRSRLGAPAKSSTIGSTVVSIRSGMSLVVTIARSIMQEPFTHHTAKRWTLWARY